MAFKDVGDRIYQIGYGKPQLRGGELSYLLTGVAYGAPPDLDLAYEKRVQKVVRDLIASGKIKSAHDVSDGGLGVAIAECCIRGGVGARIAFGCGPADSATALFGECSSTIIVTVSADECLENLIGDVQIVDIGVVRGDRLDFTILEDSDTRMIDLPVSRLTEVYESAIPEMVRGDVAAG